MADPGPGGAFALRFGVFIDGVWFGDLSRWCNTTTSWRAPLSVCGVLDALRWYLHQHHQRPLAKVQRACCHYVRGRHVNPSRSATRLDRALGDAGITRHDVRDDPGREHDRSRDPDVRAILSRLAFSQAQTMPLDTVVMLTGDPDHTPVVKRLARSGVTVIIPTVAAPRRHRITTPDSLMRAATCTPALDDLLSTALDPRYPLAYPFTRPVLGAVSEPAGDGWRYGTVTRWWQDGPHGEHGFLVDRGGRDWYLAGRALPDGIGALPVGQPVRFTGNPRYTRGRRYPKAHTPMPFQPTGLLPDSP